MEGTGLGANRDTSVHCGAISGAQECSTFVGQLDS